MSRRGAGWVLLAGAAVVLATPLAGQSGRTHMRSDIVDGGTHTRIEVDGEVRFSDDERAIEWMSPGSRLEVSEQQQRGPDRRVIFRAAGDAVERSFFRDDRERRPDASDEAWIARVLTNLIRESGLNVGPRVERLYRRGGSAAVLEEIGHIGSDGTQRLYYTALLQQPLSRAERAGVLREAGRTISSDGDRKLVLGTLLQRPGASPLELVAMLESAGRISSDGDKALLLAGTARYTALDDAEVREAFFNATAGLSSDGDKSRVLIAALTRGGVQRETVVQALATARGISSDGDRAQVLMSVPPGLLRARSVMDAFQLVLRGISSDGDKARVATWMVEAMN